MSLPLRIPTPKPPPPPQTTRSTGDDYTGIDELDRWELDEPDTERMPLPPLDWDNDSESGVKRRSSEPPPISSQG